MSKNKTMINIKDARYQKFLLEENEVPNIPEETKEGIYSIHYDISEVEQCENRSQNKILESVFHTVCELFQIENVEMQSTCHANSFFRITKNETGFNNQEGFLSPELSRDKLKNAESKEIAGAVIDLIKVRKLWDNSQTYKSIL